VALPYSLRAAAWSSEGPRDAVCSLKCCQQFESQLSDADGSARRAASHAHTPMIRIVVEPFVQPFVQQMHNKRNQWSLLITRQKHREQLSFYPAGKQSELRVADCCTWL